MLVGALLTSAKGARGWVTGVPPSAKVVLSFVHKKMHLEDSGYQTMFGKLTALGVNRNAIQAFILLKYNQ
jgi:hypothetical protein